MRVNRAPRSAILTTGVAIPTNRSDRVRQLLRVVVLGQEALSLRGGRQVKVGGEEALEGLIDHVARRSLHCVRNR